MFQVKDIHIIFRVEARLFFLQHIKAKKFFQCTGWANYFFWPKAAPDYFFKKSSSPPPQIMKWSLPNRILNHHHWDCERKFLRSFYWDLDICFLWELGKDALISLAAGNGHCLFTRNWDLHCFHCHQELWCVKFLLSSSVSAPSHHEQYGLPHVQLQWNLTVV